MSLILLARLDTGQEWKEVSNPQQSDLDNAYRFLCNEFNKYLEYKNCGVVYRFVRAEDLGQMTKSLPAIIQWLQSQDVLSYSQFTIDWVETTVDYYETMAEEGTLPDDNEVYGAIKYEVENILQVLNPRLLDAKFFKRVLAEVSK